MSRQKAQFPDPSKILENNGFYQCPLPCKPSLMKKDNFRFCSDYVNFKNNFQTTAPNWGQRDHPGALRKCSRITLRGRGTPRRPHKARKLFSGDYPDALKSLERMSPNQS